MPADPILIARCENQPGAAIQVPGSKSISCRAIVLAALAEGCSVLSGLLRGDDTNSLLAAMETLGVSIEGDGTEVAVRGRHPLVPAQPRVDLGHGGTPARFMLSVATLTDGGIVIDGSSRLRERPMGDMADLLSSLGVEVEALGVAGHLPLRVVGGPWRTNHLEVGATASSQFLSALLLVAPLMPDGLSVQLRHRATSEPYLKLTIAELQKWGVPVTTAYEDDRLARITVPSTPLHARDRIIPADASSALFWAAAASITFGSQLTIPRLQLDDGQPDAAAFKVLQAMGLDIENLEEGVQLRGPARLHAIGTIDCGGMPDAAPALAVTACFADGQTRLTGLGTLRHKESDRVTTIAGELGRAGADVVIEGDDLVIRPVPLPDTPVTIQSWDDHRIAMALAVLGLRRGGISVSDPGCVAKSYPGFWNDLARLYGEARSGDTE
ncbi:MAG: 3-phosphoshikimate 1-carboxyvinyltransferase [Phycisphaerales bacterium]|nr:3-phosphoshikimate 1-carboxyvinyltransferase [Phycisphaerales bacterium]